MLGFNRTPLQALVTTAYAVCFELLFMFLSRRKLEFPLSAIITSISLSILLNYPHGYGLLVVPPLLAIGSKYLFTYKDRHVLNPALIGVTFSILLFGERISLAPTYQWLALPYLSVFMALAAAVTFMPRIRRWPLVLSFLTFYSFQTLLRGWMMRGYLPFETLVVGSLTNPALFLFAFFMITDPRTSPERPREQVLVGFLLALLDFFFHVEMSYFTLFFAASLIGALRFLKFHLSEMQSPSRVFPYFREHLLGAGTLKRFALVPVVGVLGIALASGPSDAAGELSFTLTRIESATSGIRMARGNAYDEVDPKVRHVAKWLLGGSVSVAAGDFDADGGVDLVFTNGLNAAEDRVSLFRNRGDFRFERVPLPALGSGSGKERGLPTSAQFVDYDNDGDLDLFVLYGGGRPWLLKSRLRETGKAKFVNVTHEAGLDFFNNANNALFFDANNDGRLDLLIPGYFPDALEGYADETRLNVFDLPQPVSADDSRPFNFMPESWSQARNGGRKKLFLQDERAHFSRQDPEKWGFASGLFSVAVGAGDINQDGFPDLYIANDFGPDELYLNEQGRTFRRAVGTFFGEVGQDTYKGMNVTFSDFLNVGYPQIYVSNVHHPLLPEGSLFWVFDQASVRKPASVKDRADEFGILNEDRHGWGAAAVDLDNDGWLDLVQTNGMVSDDYDPVYATCPDYWYLNEKLTRAPAYIQRNARNWGDIRGKCIMPNEPVRVYRNGGANGRPGFVDVAAGAGIFERINGRGVAAADLNNDGRQDLVIVGLNNQPLVFRNDPPPGSPEATSESRWIGFELEADGKACNRFGIGSRVVLRSRSSSGEAHRQGREAQVTHGYDSQNDPRLHFGLGNHHQEIELEVSWCGKLERRYPGLKPGRYYRVAMDGSVRER